jgi:hypothetical protein
MNNELKIDPEDEKLVEELLQEAIQGYDRIVPPRELAAMRAAIRHDYLIDPEGRRKIRALRADPKVARSAEVRKDGTEEAAAKRAKGGSGK